MGGQTINRAERLGVIEQMLSRSTDGVRVVEIARACDVDRRTIYRDLALLTHIGLPIYQKDGRFFINHDYYLATMRLNLNEAIALFLAVRALSRHADQQNPHILSALAKLSAILPPAVSSHVTFLLHTSRSSAVDRGFVSVLEMMTRAWSERRKVKLWYSPVKGESLTIHDFAVYFIEPAANGSLYAVGYDDADRCVCAFKLHCVRRVKALQVTYTIPEHFDPRPYLATPWGPLTGESGKSMRVLLKFSREITAAIRESIQPMLQHGVTLDDKRCVIDSYVSDWHEMVPWILSWGGQMEVIEPLELRETLALEAARMTALYASLPVSR